MRIKIIILCTALLSGISGQPAAADTLIEKIRKADSQFDARSDVRSNRYDDIEAQIAEGDDINTPGQNGETPLHMAAQNNDIDITLALLRKGADAYALDNNGMSALSGSIIFGKQTFHVLLDHYVKHRKFPADFDAYVKTNSVLERAFTDNTTGSVAFDLLLAYGVDFPDAFLQRAEWTMKQYPTPEKKQRFESLKAYLARKKEGAGLPPPPAPPGHAILPPASNPPLISAIRDGDAAKVKSLLDKEEKPDQTSAYYDDSLFSRLAGGGREQARLAARPALSLALLLGHKDIAKMLLDRGADPDLRGANYRNFGQDSCETPLILAVKNGDRDMIDALLAKGADINRADCQWGNPPLGYTRDMAIAALLLEKGADPNRGGNYMSPLRTALANRDKEMLTLLLERGADPNRASPGMQNETLLHHVARENYDGSYVSLLLAHGADTGLRNAEGLTAYDIAVGKGRKDIVTLLEKSGAESGDPHSVMLQAIGRSDLATMEKLLKGGLDPNSQPYVFSVAYAAVYARFNNSRVAALDMTSLLSKYGANLKVTGENSVSLLHMAQDGEMVDFLVSKGADVNTVDRWRATPLHAAAKAGNPSVVEALLKNGADASKPDNNGLSPLAIALQGPVNRQMTDGPPTDWAREGPPYLEVIRLLAAAGAGLETVDGGRPPAFSGQTGEGYEQFRIAAAEAARKSFKLRKAGTAPAPRKTNAVPSIPEQDVFILFRMVSERFINKYDAVRWQTGKDPAAICDIDVIGAAHAVYDANKDSAPDFKSFINTLRLRGKASNRTIDGTATHPPAKFQAPSLLQMAAFYKDIPVIKALLETGADPSLPDNAGNTALHYATQGYSTDVRSTLAAIDMLLDAGAPLDSRNNDGETALTPTGFTAIGGKMRKTDQMQIIEHLLQKGADPKITRNDGYSLADNVSGVLSHLEGIKKTEYIEAQTRDYISLLDTLARQGVQKDKWRSASQQQQRTPLQAAVDRLDAEAVRTLIAQGADVNEGSYPPLMSAASAGDRGVEIATLLIDKGAKPDVRLPNDTMISKAMLQPEHGNMVDLLLARGLKPVSDDLLGFYADALTQRGKETLRKILDTGVDPNICDRSGESPLYKAAQRGNLEAVEILLSYGAKVDYCAKDPRESGGGNAAVKKLLLSSAVTPEGASILSHLEKIWYAATDCRIRGKPE